MDAICKIPKKARIQFSEVQRSHDKSISLFKKSQLISVLQGILGVSLQTNDT